MVSLATSFILTTRAESLMQMYAAHSTSSPQQQGKFWEQVTPAAINTVIYFIWALLLLPAMAMRLKDLNCSPSLLSAFLGLFLLSTLLVSAHSLPHLLIYSLFSAPVVLGCIKGTKGMNRYGQDPLDKPIAGDEQIQGRGSTSGLIAMWCLGLYFLFISLYGLQYPDQGPVGNYCGLLVACLILPPVRALFHRMTGLRISAGLRLALCIGLILIAAQLSAPPLKHKAMEPAHLSGAVDPSKAAAAPKNPGQLP